MRRINLADQRLDYDPEDPTGYRSGGARLGTLLGASDLGVSLYELPPGERLCPYHYELAEEEALLVLVGTPSLRTPEGVERLSPLDLVFFPTGPEGAHGIHNETGETVRLLMVSTIRIPSATVYPDSDKIGIWADRREDDALFHRASRVRYWSGEAGNERDAPAGP